MKITKIEIYKPNEFSKSVRVELTDPQQVNTFVTIYREMAVSAMNENDFVKAEELLNISNNLNVARNILLDMLADERDKASDENDFDSEGGAF